MQTCKTCLHSVKSETELNQLFCKRFPPVPIALPGMAQGAPTINIHCTSPMVSEQNYCGEYEPIEDDTRDPDLDQESPASL